MNLKQHTPTEVVFSQVASEMDKENSEVTTLLAKIPDHKLMMALEAEINRHVANTIECAFGFGFQCGRKPELLLFVEK